MIWILVLSFIGMVVYEIIAAVRSDQTISQYIWQATLHHPMVPFLFGLLMGHFFWQAADCFGR